MDDTKLRNGFKVVRVKHDGTYWSCYAWKVDAEHASEGNPNYRKIDTEYVTGGFVDRPTGCGPLGVFWEREDAERFVSNERRVPTWTSDTWQVKECRFIEAVERQFSNGHDKMTGYPGTAYAQVVLLTEDLGVSGKQRDGR